MRSYRSHHSTWLPQFSGGKWSGHQKIDEIWYFISISRGLKKKIVKIAGSQVLWWVHIALITVPDYLRFLIKNCEKYLKCANCIFFRRKLLVSMKNIVKFALKSWETVYIRSKSNDVTFPEIGFFWHFFYRDQLQIAYSTRISRCFAHLLEKNTKNSGSQVLWWVRIAPITVPDYLNFQGGNGRATKKLIEFDILRIFQVV